MRASRSFIAAAFFAAAISSAQDRKAIPAFPQVTNACALLSRLEVERASGLPVGEGISRLSTGTLTGCFFAGDHGGKVAILVRRGPGADWVSEQIARMNRGVQYGTYRAAPGIGERSFLLDMRGAGAVLCTFVAGYYLQVSLIGAGRESGVPDGLEQLARHAVAHLQPVGPVGAFYVSRFGPQEPRPGRP